MFRNFSSQLAAAAVGNNKNSDGDKKTMSPTLRSDIYTAVDQASSWLAGGKGGGSLPGDGMSYGAVLATIQKHFPDTKIGIDSLGNTESEVAIVVGGVTSMVLEMSRWEGMAGGMAMKTWVDALGGAYARIGDDDGSLRKATIAKGITRGINQNADVSLMTKEFTAKIQIITCLKSLITRVYGVGSEEARRAEASLSSKFI
ncbi:uncharacterized protein BT62DRAFT_909313 [Guyanagaster necrorhizus]|uniref:Uncharacterized protein n=1 Tax=Guyanagaster necrorhizus TaxID=856835 RepID=A0A9P8AMT1_9AGAR|nr:uncharacterized protein BT62DRAFT_909313 [Guyanagaster necrorhizus MCA 3950]KAG7441036.1 hypothetical protein BT62DRAFT_909313 [Guyanagaster necrorhizus MCA 3950]